MKLKLTLVVLGILLVSSLALTSCGGNPTLDVVNQFIKAEDQMFNTGDSSGLLAVEDENIVIHMMSFGDTNGNANHVKAIKGIVDGAASPITHEWFNISATGDTGSVRWTEKGMVGGKEVVYDGAYFLKVKDGKIVEAWLISDMLTYFLAAGIVQYTPAP